MPKLIQTGSTAAKDDLEFLMIDSSDHVSAKTGLTVTVTLRKPGGSFASPSGAVSEIANGWYRVAANATDNGTVGALLLHATASGADPTDDRYQVVGFDTSDGVRLGLTALPNAAASAVGGLPVAVDTSGRVDVLKINGTSQTARDIGASVLVAGDLSATMKTSVTTAATAATPTAAAVTGAVGSVTGAVGSVTGNVGGNVTGSVGSISGITFPTRFSSLAIDVSGNVTFGNTSIATVTNLTNAPTSGDFTAAMKTSLNAATPSATLSGDFSATMKTSLNAATPAVTVSDKTGFSLASGGLAAVTAWSVAITGNITGNLSGSVGSVTGLTASNLDATISSRLATSGYTAPDNADILLIKAKTDNLPASPADESLIIAATNSLATLIAALPTTTTVNSIKTVTDGLPTFPSDPADESVILAAIAALPTTSTVMPADIKKVNGTVITGNGAGAPWGP